METFDPTTVNADPTPVQGHREMKYQSLNDMRDKMLEQLRAFREANPPSGFSGHVAEAWEEFLRRLERGIHHATTAEPVPVRFTWPYAALATMGADLELNGRGMCFRNEMDEAPGGRQVHGKIRG
jgi:hypothetical protein